MTARSGRLALAGWVVAVAAAIAGLHHVGSGALAPPALGAPATWGGWLAERDPVVAAVALLRLLALGVAWYLLVASVVGTAVRVLRVEPLITLADRLTLPVLRRLLVATAGVTLASGLTPSVAPLARAPHLEVVSVATAGQREEAPPPTLTMRLLPEEAAPAPAAATAPAPAAAPAPAVPGASATRTWTTRPGDCFWSIAEQVLVEAWGREPSDAEVVPYWRQLIEANRGALADRGNADLVFPGQVFTVPPPPSPPP